MTDLIRERRQIAYNWNALPQYIFQDKDGAWRNFETETVYPTTYFNPVQYYQTVNRDAILPLNLNLKEIMFFYVIGNKFLHDFLRRRMPESGTIEDIILRSGMDDDTGRVLLALWNTYDDPPQSRKMINDMTQERNSFRQQYEAALSEESYIQRLEPVPFTDFEIDTVVKVYEISSDIVIGNIYALFNQIKVDLSMPLMITPRFYKVLKGYDYALEIPDDPKTMFLFTTTGKVEISENSQGRFEISYDFKKDKDDSVYLQSICEAIGIAPDDVELKNERINGISHFTRQTLSNVIWRDFVMNHSIASRYLVMDEHNIHVRRKKSIRQVVRRGFYVFYLEDGAKTSFTLREDENGEGVRIRILNATSLENASVMLLTLAKLFALYNEVAPQIAKEYNQILRKNAIEFVAPGSQAEIARPTKLKKIAKDMFLPNYTRKCGFLPEVVSDVEAYTTSNIPVMRFPKEGDEVEGKYFNFSCNHHENHIFPGLRKNPFENNTVYPLLPCCYRQDQNAKRTSLYREYYGSEKKLKDFKPTEGEEVQNIQYRFLISDKFVGFEQTGKCSDLINDLFMIHGPNKPVRKGVHRGKQSALECVLAATEYENFHKKDSRNRLLILADELIRLSEMDLTICAQECWNVKDPSIFLELDQYLDPKHMIRLLETVYSCRIIICSRDNFIHPNYIQGYLRWKTNTSFPIVILYEHYGSEADEASYPQCEWITVDKNDAEQIYEAVYSDYLQSLETILPHPLPYEEEFINIFEPNYTIESQHIDFYGKVYAINVVDTFNRHMTFFFEDYRLPVLYNVPLAKVGYYSPRLSPNIRDRMQIQMDKYTMYTFTEPNLESLVDEYENTRQQVEIMTENAKHLYAKRIFTEQEENWDFIQINPNAVIEYSKYLFSDSDVVYVPNQDTRDRLIFALRVFAKRYRNALLQYPSFGENIPFKYRTLHDFENQDDAVIIDIATTINWFSDFYIAKPLDGTLYNQPFITVIQDVIYKCNPISEEQPSGSSDYSVFFPQTKQLFVVGNQPNREYLVIKNLNQILKWYECIRIQSF